MLFTYDFPNQLDLSRFKKQATYYLANMREVSYHFLLPHYKLVVEIARMDDEANHLVSLFIVEIKRDQDGEIIGGKTVVPLLDSRFQELQIIKETFVIDSYKAHFTSTSVETTIDKIANLLRLISKINYLKCFI